MGPKPGVRVSRVESRSHEHMISIDKLANSGDSCLNKYKKCVGTRNQDWLIITRQTDESIVDKQYSIIIIMLDTVPYYPTKQTFLSKEHLGCVMLIQYIEVHTHTYIHTYMHADRQTDRQTDRHTGMHACMLACLLACLHMYAYAIMHIYIYIYVCVHV